FLLAGRPPFRESSAVNTILAHLQSQPPPLPDLRPEVPPGLAAVVARMMAKSPAERFQTPAEVAQALQPFVKPTAKAPTRGAPVPRYRDEGGADTHCPASSRRPALAPLRRGRRGRCGDAAGRLAPLPDHLPRGWSDRGDRPARRPGLSRRPETGRSRGGQADP